MSPADTQEPVTAFEANAVPYRDSMNETFDAEVHALYRDHAGALHHTLERLTWSGADVDDMLQDVFVIALKRPEGLLRADSARAWLYGIAVKVAAGRRRRRAVRKLFGLDDVPEPAAPGGPEEQLHRREAETLVAQALTRIAPKKREVLVLYEIEGLTGQEIALALGCPLKTVWSRLLHARRELAEALKPRTKGTP